MSTASDCSHESQRMWLTRRLEHLQRKAVRRDPDGFQIQVIRHIRKTRFRAGERPRKTSEKVAKQLRQMSSASRAKPRSPVSRSWVVCSCRQQLAPCRIHCLGT
eukprot:5114423-Alexandrium_andersonii.AAC.1